MLLAFLIVVCGLLCTYVLICLLLDVFEVCLLRLLVALLLNSSLLDLCRLLFVVYVC